MASGLQSLGLMSPAPFLLARGAGGGEPAIRTLLLELHLTFLGLGVKDSPECLLQAWPCRTDSQQHSRWCVTSRPPEGPAPPPGGSPGLAWEPCSEAPVALRTPVRDPGFGSEQCHTGPFPLRTCRPSGQRDADHVLTGPGSPEPDLGDEEGFLRKGATRPRGS